MKEAVSVSERSIEKAGSAMLIAVLAAAYFAFGKFSLVFLSENSFETIGVFASEGIALAFVLYFGPRVIAGIFLGQLALALSNGLDIDASAVIGIVNSTEAYLGFVLLRYLGFDTHLRTFKDFALLFGVIVLVLQPFSGLVSNAYLVYDGAVGAEAYVASSVDWMIGNILGQLLFTPFLLILFENFHTVRWQRFIAFGLAVGLFFYLLVLVVKIENPFLLFNLTFPVAIVVVSRYGLLYGLFFNIVISEVAAYSVKEKTGAFFVQSQMNNVVNYDLFILAHIVIVIITGILFEERKRHERNLSRMIDEAVEKNRQQELLMLQQSRLAQMGETIGMIGHQWRQPLNGLALTVQVFAKKYRNGQVDRAYVEQFEAKSMRLIGHMSSTIDDFRTFFSPGKEKNTFSLAAVIDHALELVGPMFEKEGIEVVREKHEDIMLFGYGNEIGQGIVNILNNAKDALSDSGTTHKKVAISVHSDDAFVYVSIGDNAGGIPEAIVEKIFDPYFSTKNKNGTGLGLYMTKIIVEDHCGGRLSAANGADGAVFLMQLPVQPE